MSGKKHSTLEALLDEVMLNDFDAYKQIIKDSERDYKHLEFLLGKKKFLSD